MFGHVDLLYTSVEVSSRTSNHRLDGSGCSNMTRAPNAHQSWLRNEMGTSTLSKICGLGSKVRSYQELELSGQISNQKATRSLLADGYQKGKFAIEYLTKD